MIDRLHIRRTLTYSGPTEAVLAQLADSKPDGTHTLRKDVVLTIKTAPHPKPGKPSTPKQAHARSLNWLHFQIAGAVGHLSHALTCGVKLPDPRDDADLREATRLLTAIRRRQSERKLNLKEKA